DLNGCADLLPGSASAHTRIVAAERRGATCRGGDSRAADRARSRSPRKHFYSRECAGRWASSRRSAPDPPHHCPLAVSQPLRCRIFLTPGAWALCGGKAAVIWPRVRLIGGIRLPDAACRHSGWITRLGRTANAPERPLAIGEGLGEPRHHPQEH